MYCSEVLNMVTLVENQTKLTKSRRASYRFILHANQASPVDRCIAVEAQQHAGLGRMLRGTVGILKS